MRTVLYRALPGGLTNLLMVLVTQMLLSALKIPAGQISTVCAAILAVVGLLVLHRTCRPYNTFRRILVFAMAAALLFCFTVLSGFFDLSYGSWKSLIPAAALIAVTPAAFWLIETAITLPCWKRRKQ